MKIPVCIFLFLAFLFSVSAQNSHTRSIGGMGDEEAVKITPANDGGWLILGTTQTIGAGQKDIYVRKTDSCWAVQWEKAYGGMADDVPSEIRPFKNDGYLIVGTSDSFKDYKWQAYLIKIDNSGNLVWKKTFGRRENIYGKDVAVSDNSIYVLAKVDGDKSICLFNTDYEGKLNWCYDYARKTKNWGYKLLPSDKGGVIVGLMTRSFSHAIFDICLLNIGSRGQVLWSKAYGGPHDDFYAEMIRLKNGNILLSGAMRSFHSSNPKPFLMSISQTGTMEWLKTYVTDSEEKGISVSESDDGSLLMLTEASAGPDAGVPFLYKTNKEGEVLWKKKQQPGGAQHKAAYILEADKFLLLSTAASTDSRKQIQLSFLDEKRMSGWASTAGEGKHARPVEFSPSFEVSSKNISEGSLGVMTQYALREAIRDANGIYDKKILDAGPDTELCGGSVILDAGKTYPKYFWQDGSASQFFVARKEGVYTVSITDGCTIYSDTVRVWACGKMPKQISAKKDVTEGQPAIGVAILLKIQFEKGSHKIIPESEKAVQEVFEFMQKNPGANIELVGHTDNVGKAHLNMKLSKKRVEEIKRQLVAKGIEDGRISLAFFGGGKPVADNSNEETRKLNRRVEMKVIRY